MSVIPLIGHLNHAPVKTPLVCAALLASDQKHRLAPGIEGECYTPDFTLL